MQLPLVFALRLILWVRGRRFYYLLYWWWSLIGVTIWWPPVGIVSRGSISTSTLMLAL